MTSETNQSYVVLCAADWLERFIGKTSTIIASEQNDQVLFDQTD